ncbi:NAD(P)-dependent oxidoreductase [Aggregicoccus sp. 17bor-14]|uniref:NAD(P)-dependent oxidoreductase n=1 Tax=Myxococcaceae TaxID=31 RepID=UPI00129CD53A|nr:MULTISPECIES: NAD(P)-dependent oxidoreductase [Myxococcaceae]MBF5043793.1 NAD(P)-dependent oxidoreductase [Simulacricoccus sp. 17bor-14]MRI89546.1 NAD(P)-dependent oxidoreductase [Aggregicoccus sp. 17bor-14]
MIAFLGMGLLGSNFTRALRLKGHELNVWNRSPEKAQAVAAETGARAFTDPAEAVRGAERVHLTLSDDAAVDDVLERARPGLATGVVLVDHTTTTASGAKERIARWKERGVDFVHAPVFMGPQNARESTGTMLVSGDEAPLARVRPALEAMTGKLVHLGPRPEAAASMKLIGNMFLMFLTSGFADMLSLAKALEVAPADAAKLFEYFNPGATLGARMARMLSGSYSDPSWELAMARKDARLMQEEAARAGVPLAVLPAIASRMDEVIAEGHAHADWTVLGKDPLGK